MRSVRHMNIVYFYGAGRDEHGTPFLVTEYCSRGSLRGILSDRSVKLDWPRRMRFALDAARGIQFLHSLDPPRIHRDLKCANLLVSSSWVVKVADFGTARLVAELRPSPSADTDNAPDHRHDQQVSAEAGAATTAHPHPSVEPAMVAAAVGHDKDASLALPQFQSLSPASAASSSASPPPQQQRQPRALVAPTWRRRFWRRRPQPPSLPATRDADPAASHSAKTMTRDIGTTLWQAPEVMMGAEYGTPADVYRCVSHVVGRAGRARCRCASCTPDGSVCVRAVLPLSCTRFAHGLCPLKASTRGKCVMR